MTSWCQWIQPSEVKWRKRHVSVARKPIGDGKCMHEILWLLSVLCCVGSLKSVWSVNELWIDDAQQWSISITWENDHYLMVCPDVILSRLSLHLEEKSLSTLPKQLIWDTLSHNWKWCNMSEKCMKVGRRKTVQWVLTPFLHLAWFRGKRSWASQDLQLKVTLLWARLNAKYEKSNSIAFVKSKWLQLHESDKKRLFDQTLIGNLPGGSFLFRRIDLAKIGKNRYFVKDSNHSRY